MIIPKENMVFMMISTHARVAATGMTMGMANQMAIAKAMLSTVPNAFWVVIVYSLSSLSGKPRPAKGQNGAMFLYRL